MQRYLSNILHQNDVVVERQWPAFPRDKRYSPRIDVAIGPFATETKLIDRYDQLSRTAKPFLDHCFDIFKENMRAFNPGIFLENHNGYTNFNQNARCFIAIEIEKSGSRKHRLGDIVNASALGRIGLIIAWDAAALRSFLRIITYFDFLREVKKNTFQTANVAILEKEQFLYILDQFINH